MHKKNSLLLHIVVIVKLDHFVVYANTFPSHRLVGCSCRCYWQQKWGLVFSKQAVLHPFDRHIRPSVHSFGCLCGNALKTAYCNDSVRTHNSSNFLHLLSIRDPDHCVMVRTSSNCFYRRRYSSVRCSMENTIIIIKCYSYCVPMTEADADAEAEAASETACSKWCDDLY